MRATLLVAFFLCFLSFANAQPNYQREIKNVAVTLYESFSKTQQFGALRAFNDTARSQWNNLPIGLRPRAGTSVGNMNNEQRMLVHRLLAASLSSQGYLKSTSIMHLDELINSYYDSLYIQKKFNDETRRFLINLKWSPKNYFFAFFGSPSKDNRWGFKLEGHHLSLNFTITGQQVSVTPYFVGTDPAEYGVSEYAGWRVLAFEEDLGLKLLRSLTDAQKKVATKSTEVPGDIITAAESGKRLVDYWGVQASALTREQQLLLQQLIREFVFNISYEKAQLEYEKIEKAGFGKIYFGWIGSDDEKKPHYYIVNGPTFLIEFDNNGGPNNSANHIHAIWREKGNEYGEDVLKKHYQAEH